MDSLRPDRCSHCFLPEAFCICGAIPVVQNRTRLLVIRHAKEAFKTSNTARLAVQALQNSALLSYGGPADPPDFDILAMPGTWLLYPSEGGTTPPSTLPPARLVVLDGSWTQARRMTQRMASLRGLPRLSLPPPRVGSERLRQPPLEEGMSTLEAIAEAMAQLEGESIAAPLRALHDEHCRRIHVLRGKALPASPDEALALGARRS